VDASIVSRRQMLQYNVNSYLVVLKCQHEFQSFSKKKKLEKIGQKDLRVRLERKYERLDDFLYLL
jgi:hypothetical protein